MKTEDKEILYEDEQILLHKGYILIKKYYFPLATSKFIAFSDIDFVIMHDNDGITTRWGTCSRHLNNWFPLDKNRKNKTKFIELHMKGKKIVPSITPDLPQKVFRLIWEIQNPGHQLSNLLQEHQPETKKPDAKKKEVKQSDDEEEKQSPNEATLTQLNTNQKEIPQED